MTLRPLALIASLLLAQPAVAVAQDSAAQRSPRVDGARPGPPPPLAGVPIALRCEALLPLDHPVLGRYPGQDLNDLAVLAEVADAQTWTQAHLCDTLWDVLTESGAHPAPDDVHLPARAILNATLRRLWVEGSRVVEQRIGSTIMPVSIPHWAVAMAWDFEFSVDYSGGAEPSREGAPAGALQLSLGGAAEQDDYADLRMGSLLRGAALEAFADLPWVMADDGHLGDLLFALVPSPPSAPPEMGVSGALADGFWQLLSTDARQRHDALAFYLSCEQVPFGRRLEMARWFLLNDPDLGLRRDALGWVVQGESADRDERFSDETHDLLAWLVLKDRSSRMRAAAVHVLGSRSDEASHALLVAASADEDARVADRALTGLRGAPPPTSAELELIPKEPSPPAVAAWTRALDGRVTTGSGASRDRDLFALALAAGGPAAETWMVRWVARGVVADGDLGWAVGAWRGLATDGSPRVRRETLLRLGRESADDSAAEALVARIRGEPEPDLKVVAIEALGRVDVDGLRPALLEASGAPEVAVRAAAVTALTQVPGVAVYERLTKAAAEDPAGKVRRRARKALRSRAKAELEAGS